MIKKRMTDMKVCDDTYFQVMRRTSKVSTMSDAQYRSMLVSLKPGCYVETSDDRGYSVRDVRRDLCDIPVAVEVCGDGRNAAIEPSISQDSEWIDVDEIVSWEPWDFIAPVYLFQDENVAIGELMFLSEVK